MSHRYTQMHTDRSLRRLPTAWFGIRVYLCLSVAILTAACTVGPNYERPAIEAPAKYRFEDAAARDAANAGWWTLYGDQELARLVAIALAENKNVLIAAARVEEFYGRYGVQRGQQFPQVGLSANAGSQRASRVSTPAIPEPGDVTADFYSVDLGVSFELDLWGRLRRATEAARADLLTFEETPRTV